MWEFGLWLGPIGRKRRIRQKTILQPSRMHRRQLIRRQPHLTMLNRLTRLNPRLLICQVKRRGRKGQVTKPFRHRTEEPFHNKLHGRKGQVINSSRVGYCGWTFSGEGVSHGIEVKLGRCKINLGD